MLRKIREIRFLTSVPYNNEPCTKINDAGAEVTNETVQFGDLLVPMSNVQYILFAQEKEVTANEKTKKK